MAGVSIYDPALKLLSNFQFLNAFETVHVAAVEQNPKAVLPGFGFLIDHLHEDPTYHVLAALYSKREVHVFLMGLNPRVYVL